MTSSRATIRNVQGSEKGDYEPKTKAEHKSSASSLLFTAVLCVVLGVVFGFAMEKGRVFEPSVIIQQMVFNKMIMLKMFLSAMATGMFCLGLLSMIPLTSKIFYNTCQSYFNKLCDKGVLSSVVGGGLLGLGMTLCGSCPTSLFAQLGALVPNAGYVLGGAMLATLLYGIFKPQLDKLVKPSITESTNPWVKSPFFVMALPIAVMFGMLVVSFEILKPWTKEVKMLSNYSSVFTMKAWPPYVTGMIIGTLQIPLVLVLNETLGGSSSLLVVWAQVLVGPLRHLSPFISKYQWGMNRWWQIFYVSGVMLGAYLSATASNTLGFAKGVAPLPAFIGGFCIFFGSRIAGGCTSGHGLSGMAFLSILSFIAVVSMFITAIGSAFTLQYFGMLPL